MLKKYSLLIISLAFLVSCDSKTVFSEYKSVSNGWEKGQKIAFSFPAPDTINSYNIFVNLRNDETYKYSNLFLIVHMNFPEGKTISDTLEYAMAKPNGEWLGEGFTSLKENKLWYRENIIFPNSGVYNVQIEHAMRINGSVDGIISLDGIKDVGIKIESTSTE